MTKEDLQQLRELMHEELKPINERLDKMDERFDKIDERLDKMDERLDKMDERLEKLEEDMEIVKYSTNELVRWVDTNFRHQYPFPVDRDIS